MVTTDVGGTAEAVAHAETGLVVRRATPARPPARWHGSPRSRSGHASWASAAGRASASASRGEAMVEGYARALAEVATR